MSNSDKCNAVRRVRGQAYPRTCEACGLTGPCLYPAFAAAPTPPAEAVTDAARDVLAERRRQVEAEGWTPAHDDAHDDGELAEAAAAYALDNGWAGAPPPSWPWSAAWWKPKDRRSNLVRAAALLLAEIERLDRAAALAAKEGR